MTRGHYIKYLFIIILMDINCISKIIFGIKYVISILINKLNKVVNFVYHILFIK